MPIIDVSGVVRALGGTKPLTTGTIAVEYRDARGMAATLDGNAVTFSPKIEIPIRDGEPERPVDVPATDGRFYARFTVTPPPGITEWKSGPVAIPANATTLEDLIPVNPATFQPTGESVAAWIAAIAEFRDLRDEALARAVTFHPHPTLDDALRAVFPASLLRPDGSSIRISVEAS